MMVPPSSAKETDQNVVVAEKTEALHTFWFFTCVEEKRRDSLETRNFTGVEECQSEPTSTETHK